MLDIFGSNILTSDFEIWEKHRRVVGPHFSLEKHLRSIHSASVRHAHTMFQNWEKEGLQVKARSSFANFTLDVIGSAAFGYELHTLEKLKLSEFPKDEIPEGVTLTLGKCLESILNAAIAYYVVGKNVLSILPFEWARELHYSAREFPIYFEFLKKKKRLETGDKYDLLSLMIKSEGLTDQEMKADTFIFFIAGHETVWNSFVL